MARRPRDLTPEELREASAALAEEYAEADRIAAPLAALQWLDAELEARGALDRGKGQGVESVHVEGEQLIAVVRTWDLEHAGDASDPPRAELRLAACLDVGITPASLLTLMIRDAEQPVQPLSRAAGGTASGDAFRVIDDGGNEWRFLPGEGGGLIVSVSVGGVVRNGNVEVVFTNGRAVRLPCSGEADTFMLGAEAIRDLAASGGELKFHETR